MGGCLCCSASEKEKSDKNEEQTADPPLEAKAYTFRELAAATNNFKLEFVIGEGGFGMVFKGHVDGQKNITQLIVVPKYVCEINQCIQDVAVKMLDHNGSQGNKEFLVETLMLCLLHHPNLIKLIGYCSDGDQRLLVYEHLPLGCLEDHLFDLLPDKETTLDWNARMKIAAGAAMGLQYMHEEIDPPVIYRDMKSANILLDDGFHPKLSDFGLAKLGPVGDQTHVSTHVMGTHGYCAPEYAMTGHLTVMSDVYSFGVVLLELLTGRRALDETKPSGEQHLVAWARPLFKNRKNFWKMADPLLRGQYPIKGLYQALAVTAMCLQEQADKRPSIKDIVTALQFLSSQTYNPDAPPDPLPLRRNKDDTQKKKKKKDDSQDGSTSKQDETHMKKDESPDGSPLKPDNAQKNKDDRSYGSPSKLDDKQKKKDDSPDANTQMKKDDSQDGPSSWSINR